MMRPHTSPGYGYPDTYAPKRTPQLRKYSYGLNTTATSDNSDYFRDSIDHILKKQVDHKYPEIQDGASAWYSTIDRLSKKITSQRHELWDMQSKLRTEAEKNRDLAKVIQADRREHREVVSALTSKIESLERQLQEFVNNVSPATEPPKFTHLTETAQSVQRPQQPQQQMHPTQPVMETQPQPIPDPRGVLAPVNAESHFVPLVEDLYTKLNALSIENIKLKREMLNKETQDITKSEHEGKIKQEPESKHEPKHEPVQEPTTEPQQEEKASVESSEEFKAMLASNKELHEKLRSQNEEFTLQRLRYEELRVLMESLMNGLSSLQNNNNAPVAPAAPAAPSTLSQPHSQPHSQPQVPSTQRTSHRKQSPSPALRTPQHTSPILASPVSSAGTQSSVSSPQTTKEENSLSTQQSISAESPLPKPLQQSSTNQSIMHGYDDDTSPTASSTSTPSVLLRRSSAAATNPDLQKLDNLYRRLKQGKLTPSEIERFEDIYQNSPQALAERPQLHADLKRLVGGLNQHAPIKHSAIVSKIHNELF